MIIASISVGRRDKEKLVIKTECGKYISARVDDAYMLRVGQEISEEKAEELNALFSKTLAKKSAARTLARRSVSKHELSKKLREKGFSDEDTSDAVEWFSEHGFVDDEAYAKALCEYYTNRGYGEGRLREEFYRRGIAREIWEEIFEALPSRTDDIRALVEKKLHGEEMTKEKKQKIVAFLLRRGFGYGEIRDAMGNMEEFD